MLKTFINKICLVTIITSFILTANAGLAKAESMKILVFGDSLVAGYGVDLSESYPSVLEKTLRDKGHDITVINHGVSGDTTSGGVSRLAWSLKEKPDFVILELGANDMLRAINPDITRSNLDKMLNTIVKENKIPTLLVGIKATPNLGVLYVGGYDKLYKELAEKYKTGLYHFFLEEIWDKPELMQEDNVHPNSLGIKTMVEKTLPYVEKLIGEK